MKRIGIIAALDAEADVFLAGAGDAVPGPVPTRATDYHGTTLTIVTSGIGKVNAAVAATFLAIRFDVELLFIIGTAGTLRRLENNCFEIVEAVQHDYGAVRPGGFAHYGAGDWPIGEALLAPFAALPLAATGLPKTRIVTGDAFVECPDHSSRLREALRGDLVDMETAAVAQVAARLGVPWAAIKATTDDANGDSVGDFMANLAMAAARSAAAAEAAISLLSLV